MLRSHHQGICAVPQVGAHLQASGFMNLPVIHSTFYQIPRDSFLHRLKLIYRHPRDGGPVQHNLERVQLLSFVWLS